MYPRWAVGIEQLLSYGVPLTQAHLDAVGKNGQALALGCLPDPDYLYGGYERPMEYPTGGPVYLPQFLTLYAPETVYHYHYSTGTKTMGEIVEEYHGENFTTWASYIGESDDAYDFWHPTSLYGYGDPQPVRVWQCLPVEEGTGLDAIAWEFSQATTQMMSDSKYPEIEHLYGIFNGDDWLYPIFEQEEAQSMLVNPDDTKVLEFLVDHEIGSEEQREYLALRAGCLTLAAEGFMDDAGMWSGYLPIRPLVEYLKDGPAKDLWTTLIAQVETSEYLISDALAGTYMKSVFDHQERITQ